MTVKKITTTRYVDEETEQEYKFEPVEDTIVREETENGYKVKYLSHDSDPISPAEDQDPNYFLVYYHRDFWLPSNIVTKESLRDWLAGAEEPEKYYIFPVEAYIHSGVSLTLGSFRGRLPQGHYEFDTCCAGAVVIGKGEFDDEGAARKSAEGFIEYWNQYLRGDVWCCVVEKFNKAGEQVDYDIVCGYFGFEDAKKCLKTEL